MSDVLSSGEGESTLPSSAPTTSPSPTSEVDWQAIEADSDFHELIREKRNFIIPATIVFLVYYFGFLILVGYFPSFAEVNVFGNINLAYLIAISEFIMAWIIVYLYARRAGTFDKLAQAIIAKVKGTQHE